MNLPMLPAGVGLTHLRVYTSQAPDGQRGGSPHMHLACAELYYVLGGSGAVEFLSAAEGYRRVALSPGATVHFTPGVIHRLINDDDRLELLVVMQNSGLPERGDAVFTFPTDHLADQATYAAATVARDLVGAERRRDLAVRGFRELVECFQGDAATGRQRLQTFYELALALVRPQVREWSAILEAGPAQAAQTTAGQLAAIADGDAGYLAAGQVAQLAHPDDTALRLGMCGRLWPYLPEGSTIV